MKKNRKPFYAGLVICVALVGGAGLGCAAKVSVLDDPLLADSPARIALGRDAVLEGERLTAQGDRKVSDGENLKDEGAAAIREGKELRKLGKLRIAEGRRKLESVELLETAERMRREGESMRSGDEEL